MIKLNGWTIKPVHNRKNKPSGLYPITIRITKNRKTSYAKTDLRVLPESWNKEKMIVVSHLESNKINKELEEVLDYIKVFISYKPDCSHEEVKSIVGGKLYIEERKDIVLIHCHSDKPKEIGIVPTKIQGVKSLNRVPKNEYTSGHCVYFLCYKGEVVYIGRSENVFRRIQGHLGDKQFDDVFYVNVKPDQLSVVETSLIAELSPKYNKKSKTANQYKTTIANQFLSNKMQT